ncbi:MAG: hypothetical protein KGL39_60770, partial [Patescibacteria group bacterium]|nr:hypothetical protein [Patescibacteria group bacterium]
DTPQVKLIAVSPLVALSKEMAPTDPQDVEASKVTHLWFLNGKVKVPGRFVVTVTSPMDASIQATFKTSDSGGFTYEGFSKTRVPAAWSWLDESGDSWIPIQMHFQSENSTVVFEVIQWVKQNENHKITIRKFEEHLMTLLK